jgi:sugar-specific transcriptional regulator TrmB
MNEQLVTHIEELGLSNKEARVYVANLMLGASSVQNIADQAGIKRVTTYVILESLIGLGLVSQSMKGKKTYFIAEEPTNLERLLDKREQELKDQKINFDQILPELLGLKSIPKESPHVKFYDGAEGIKGIFATFFSSYAGNINQTYGVSNLDQLHAFFPELAKTGVNPERAKNKISSQFLYTTTRGPIYKETDEISNRESRWVPAEKYPFQGDFNIVGDYIILLSLSGSNPIGITIHSRDLAQGMLALFNLAWDGAATYNEIAPK